MTCCSPFPAHIPILDYNDGLTDEQIEDLDNGGSFSITFDLERGIIVLAGFCGRQDDDYMLKLKALVEEHSEYEKIIRPILDAYPENEDGDDPAADVYMVLPPGADVVKVHIQISASFTNQDDIEIDEVLTLEQASAFLGLVEDFACMATDCGERPLNYG